MNIDKGLCCAIIASKEIKPVTSAGIDPEDVFPPWDESLRRIISHYLQHNIIPSKDAIFTQGEYEDPPDVLDYYVEEIRRRKLKSGISKGIKKIMSHIASDDPDIALKELQQMSVDLEMKGHVGEIVNVFSNDPIDKFLTKYEKRKNANGPDGIRTLWPSFDEESFGFQPEEVVVIVGKKKTMKTFLALALTHNIWNNGVSPILIVSMEMSVDQMLQRLLAFHTGAAYDLLRKAKLPDMEEKPTIEKIQALKDSPGILITDMTRVSDTYDLEVVCAEVKPSFVFVDGLYILQPRDRKLSAMHEKVGSVIKDMKRIASRYSLTVLSTTQFNRKVKYGHMDATTDEIASSDAIGQFADCCIGLFPFEKTELHGPTAVIKTLAAREFRPVDILIHYDLDRMDFSEISKIDEDNQAMKKEKKKENKEDKPKPPVDNKESDDIGQIL